MAERDRYCCFLFLLRKDLEKFAALNQNISFRHLKKKCLDYLNYLKFQSNIKSKFLMCVWGVVVRFWLVSLDFFFFFSELVQPLTKEPKCFISVQVEHFGVTQTLCAHG